MLRSELETHVNECLREASFVRIQISTFELLQCERVRENLGSIRAFALRLQGGESSAIDGKREIG